MVSYRRILLKLSGEALSSSDQNLDSDMLKKVVSIVQSVLDLGVEIAIVVGGGNLYRGCLLYTSPSPRDRQKSRMPSSA